MSDKLTYSAKEAIAKLKIPPATFYEKVKHGDIPSIPHPLGKRGARYPKQDIDDLAAKLEEFRRLV